MKSIFNLKTITIGIILSLIFITIFYLNVKGDQEIKRYVDKMHLEHAQKSDIPVEVAIVTAEKDFETLPYSVKSVRKYLQNPIAEITLVAPNSEKAVKLAQSLNIKFMDENELLNLKEFKDYISSQGWGLKHIPEWYYQQFLKLYFYKKSKAQYYFIIDSDIVLTQPMTLVTNDGIHNFYVGKNEGHYISQLSIEKILGKSQFVPQFSFIADLMCFDKNIVKNLIEVTEKNFNKSFHYISLELEQNSEARFSEYELYGVYANFHKDNNIISSYIPKSNIVHKRKELENDQRASNSLFIPYIAYHSWIEKM